MKDFIDILINRDPKSHQFRREINTKINTVHEEQEYHHHQPTHFLLCYRLQYFYKLFLLS